MSGVTAESRCLVYCRLRPANNRDFDDGAYELVTVDGSSVTLLEEHTYEYDGTFGPESTQQQVFRAVALPCIRHAVEGFCSALMCYGQTGTGKTFTMCNVTEGNEGIIPRTAEYLFEHIVDQEAPTRFVVTAQFIQIYRDQLSDLMVAGDRERIDIHFDRDGGVTLQGCTTHNLHSKDELLQLYVEGNRRRVCTKTAMNVESSRGHTALILKIASSASEECIEAGAKTLHGKVTLIDLAGYERFGKTGILGTNPVMKDEAKTINASLLALGHVVSSLSHSERHIPWRDAKLTRLLQDSIGGRSRTSIILTVGPSSEHLHETTHTLQFGLRAMAVKVESKAHITVDYEKLASRLQAVIEERDKKINSLELQLEQHSAGRAGLAERHHVEDEDLARQQQQRLDVMHQEGANAEQIKKLEDLFAVERDNLNEEHMEELGNHEELCNRVLLALAKDQRKHERQKQTELRVAQQRIIQEFQKKTESTSDVSQRAELLRALQQLAEKDTLLASRASDIATLHCFVGQLLQQLNEADIAPALELEMNETYCDVSQMEVLQRELEGEVQHYKTQAVELRAQLEALSESFSSRLNETLERHREHQEIGELVLPTLSMVDAEEHESLRLVLQTRIDSAVTESNSLKAQIAALKEELNAQQHGDSRRRSMSFFEKTRGKRSSSQIELPHTSAIAGSSSIFMPTIHRLQKRLQEIEALFPLSQMPHQHIDSYGDAKKEASRPGSSACREVEMQKLVEWKEGDIDSLLTLCSNVEDRAEAEALGRRKAEEQLGRAMAQLLAAGITPRLNDTRKCTDVSELENVQQVPRSPREALETLKKVLFSSRKAAMAFANSGTKPVDWSERDEIIVSTTAELVEASDALAKSERLNQQLLMQLKGPGATPLSLGGIGESAESEELENSFSLHESNERGSTMKQVAKLAEDTCRSAAPTHNTAALLSEQVVEAGERLSKMEAENSSISQALAKSLEESAYYEGKVKQLAAALTEKERELLSITRALMEVQSKYVEEESSRRVGIGFSSLLPRPLKK